MDRTVRLGAEPGRGPAPRDERRVARYRIDLTHAFAFAEKLSAYNTRLQTVRSTPGRELIFDYDGPIEDARDALLDILAIALSDALTTVEEARRGD